jgi:DNA-directed RNA polymerase specialized sigma24 family protein
VDLDDHLPAVAPLSDQIVDLDEALTKLAAGDPMAARVVTLHIFGGLSVEQVAECIGVSRSTAYEQWAYARAWLRCALDDADSSQV